MSILRDANSIGVFVTLLSNIFLVSVARPCYVPYGCLSLVFAVRTTRCRRPVSQRMGESPSHLIGKSARFNRGFYTCLGQMGAKPAQNSIPNLDPPRANRGIAISPLVKRQLSARDDNSQ